MLKQYLALQGPSTNSDEFSASQCCSSNANQQGYTQSTPSSVRTSQVAPQGPSSSNEQGNHQCPTSSREVLQLTPSLSSLVTLPVSEHSVGTPTNLSSTEPQFPANQSIRQNSDSITTYDRAPNHDRVVLKLDSTRSEALQVISNLKSEFHTYHHREVVHISYERTLIDSLQKLCKDNKAQRDSCDFSNCWTRERFIANLEIIWPQTVRVADKSFLEAILDLHVQCDMSDAKVELQTFTDLMDIHRHHTQEDNGKAIKSLLEKINDQEKINWHLRFQKTLAECDISHPLKDLVDYRYVLMNTFQGANVGAGA